MTDPQHLIDDIRSFTQASDQTYSDALKVMASEYVAACGEANQRLRRCEEFLKQGLRSEAIQFSQAEPSLLDLLAILDFPEREQWEQICTSYNLPAPPVLRLATAEALNRAYADEQPLEHLLRRHRRMALSRAPLTVRLDVLRQIGQIDAGNPVWGQDASQFESVRLKQIEREVEEAFHGGKSQVLYDLYQELQATPWTVPPATVVMDSVSNFVLKDANRSAMERLYQVTARLEQAHLAMDEPTARKLADEWNDLSRHFPQMDSTSPLSVRVSPVLKWLARRSRQQAAEFAYQAALDVFQRALGHEEVGEQELQEMKNEVLRLGGDGIPPHVQESYRERMSLLRNANNRRERFIVAATFALAAIALVGFLIFLKVWHR